MHFFKCLVLQTWYEPDQKMLFTTYCLCKNIIHTLKDIALIFCNLIKNKPKIQSHKNSIWHNGVYPLLPGCIFTGE